MAGQNATKISMGVTALVLAIVGTAVFFIGTRGIGMKGDVGWLMFAAGGVMMLVSMILGLVGAVRNDGRVAGVIALIVAIVAAVLSEIR